MSIRKYETLVIARPEFEEDRLKDLIARLKERIERNNGQLLEIVNWGLRKLAYPIKQRGEKFFYGWYFLLIYVGDGKVINELESYMKLIDDTIRFQTVKIADQAERVEGVEPVVREQVVPEVRLREDGEGLEAVEPSRQRKPSREELYRARVIEKAPGAEAKEEAKEAEPSLVQGAGPAKEEGEPEISSPGPVSEISASEEGVREKNNPEEE